MCCIFQTEFVYCALQALVNLKSVSLVKNFSALLPKLYYQGPNLQNNVL